MALFNGTNVVADTTGLRMSRFTTATRPVSPVQGQVIWNTTIKKLEMYDGGYWKAVTDNVRPFLYRTVITTSYVAGGYKDASPWTNVNRMLHSTDVCTNLGNLLPEAGTYVSGANNLTKAFVWGTQNSFSGASTNVATFSMATETNTGLLSGILRGTRNDAATVFKEHYFAYIGGGGTGDMDVFNLTTESMYRNSIGGDIDAAEGSGMSDEWAGYLYTDSGSWKLSFSTTVQYEITDTAIRGAHGQQKGISSKLNKGYAGNEGSYNGGYNLRRFNFITDTQFGTSPKPIANCGEENFDMGQDKQYCLGNYDGAQNNRGWRYNYASESGFELGAGSVRTGVPGGSSGHCFWKG
jgi:hypothetical protein